MARPFEVEIVESQNQLDCAIGRRCGCPTNGSRAVSSLCGPGLARIYHPDFSGLRSSPELNPIERYGAFLKALHWKNCPTLTQLRQKYISVLLCYARQGLQV